ncbi:MAG: CHRD domain-containing protein [Gemmatimonadaceae bacterium]
MKTQSVLTIAAAALLWGACGGGGLSYPEGSAVTPGTPRPQTVAPMGLSATLQPQGGGTASGSVSIRMIGGSTGAASPRVDVTLTGGPPARQLAWHIHSGDCGSNGPIVGQPGAYGLISTDNQGQGRLTLGLPFGLPQGIPLYVNVHSADGQNVIACGPLNAGPIRG